MGIGIGIMLGYLIEVGILLTALLSILRSRYVLSVFWFSVLGILFVYGYLFDQLRGSTLSVMESVGLAPLGILFSPLTVATPTLEGLLGLVFLVAIVGARLLIYKKNLS